MSGMSSKKANREASKKAKQQRKQQKRSERRQAAPPDKSEQSKDKSNAEL
jgi:hypothetical protein